MVGPHRLKHMAQAGAPAIPQPAGQHGTAGAEDGGDIQPGGRHQQARHILVAVGHHDQPVKLVGGHHGLGGVGNEVPGDQGILHPHMAHGNAVTDRDGGEGHRGSPRRPDAGLDRLHNFIQVHVTGYNLIPGAHHPHQGPVQLLLGIAQGVEQGPVGGPFHAFFDLIGTHQAVLLIKTHTKLYDLS